MKDQIINGWFSEVCNMWPGRALSIKLKKTLYSERSKFQQIDVYQTETCGVMLVLDGIIQCTQYDEFTYQEMLTHLPMFSHPNPERVLVIGGGDGGILREITKHSCVKEIDICEIDEEVINVSKRFLSTMACGFDDPRVNVRIADGNEFIKDRQAYYDVVIVDSSDPIGPAEALFQEPFYASMKSALKAGGVIATQSESFFLHQDVVKNLYNIVGKLFPVYGYAYILIPTYPGGNIGISLGSLGPEVKKPARKPDAKMKNELKYYSEEIHEAAFILPAFGKRMLDAIESNIN
jgi:spermidine synthase